MKTVATTKARIVEVGQIWQWVYDGNSSGTVKVLRIDGDMAFLSGTPCQMTLRDGRPLLPRWKFVSAPAKKTVTPRGAKAAASALIKFASELDATLYTKINRSEEFQAGAEYAIKRAHALAKKLYPSIKIK